MGRGTQSCIGRSASASPDRRTASDHSIGVRHTHNTAIATMAVSTPHIAQAALTAGTSAAFPTRGAPSPRRNRPVAGRAVRERRPWECRGAAPYPDRPPGGGWQYRAPRFAARLKIIVSTNARPSFCLHLMISRRSNRDCNAPDHMRDAPKSARRGRSISPASRSSATSRASTPTRRRRCWRAQTSGRSRGDGLAPVTGRASGCASTGYRRDHLRALARHVEVGDYGVRIMGSKSNLLRTLVAAERGNRRRSACPAQTHNPLRQGQIPRPPPDREHLLPSQRLPPRRHSL